MNVAGAMCKLGGTNQYVPPTKKHAHQLLEKMAGSRYEAGKIQVESGKTMFYCAYRK